MKRTTLVFALGLILALPMAAQPSPPPEQVLREVLELTDAQIAAVQALMTQRAAQLEPLHRQIYEAEQRVAQLLSNPTPDACAVGTAVGTVHSLQRQVGEELEEFRSALAAIFTDPQREKLAFIFHVEGAVRAAGVLHQLGL